MFDFHAFLTSKFNGATEVLAFLSAYGAPSPNYDAVNKWFQRRSMPGDWFAVLVAYMELDEGGSLQLLKYVRGRQ